MNKWIKRILKFVLIGFVVVLGLSLAYGTTSFNKYCLQAQSGDWDGALAFYGPEHSGFLGCKLDTLTLNSAVLFFGMLLLQYLAQIYLIAVLNKHKYLMHIWITTILIVLLASLSYLASTLFPHVSANFLEGNVSFRKEPFSVIPPLISTSELFSLSIVNTTKQLSLILYAGFSLFSGPLAGIWLVNNFAERLKLKSGLKLFVYTLLASVTSHVLIIGLVQWIFMAAWKPYRPTNFEIQTESPFEREVLELELPTQEPQYIEMTLPPQERIYGQ